ncbi:MAG TPA: hypothetical protein VKR06_42975 [Ktedonosporobacter sp.]|nr:hypothetical protein [Ktedonosporobacter sp.]
MSVTSPSIVVGVFRDRSMAEQALEALYNLGFTQEQIRYCVPGNSGRFFEDLKSLFRGAGNNGGSLASDLVTMGLSDEEARYYANEYLNGRIILAVQSIGRRQDALSILHQHGASIPLANTAPLNEAALSNVTAFPLPESGEPDVVCEISALPTQIESIQPQVPAAQESFAPENQQHEAMLEHHEEQQASVPVMLASEHYDTQPVAANPDSFASHPASLALADPKYQADFQTAQMEPVAPKRDPAYQITQIAEAETQAPSDNPVTAEPVDELQRLQEQLQAVQQQLQEAKAQLQAEREREARLKERHQKLQETRQHLQATLSELEATLTELRETQERVKRYQ